MTPKFEVTDKMLDAAEQAYDTIAAIEHDAWCYTAPTRAAIQAAIEASGLLELIALADAICDYADANCRAFPIETAPNDRAIETWDSVGLYWLPVVLHDENFPDADFTHWREPLPPPSNPPLPAVFSDLGAALERLKEGK